MNVSIIIPTYNEKDNITKLVDDVILNVKKITNKYEVIVVDDDSPDETGNICSSYFLKNVKVKVFIRKKDKGFASAIYFGIKKANNNFVIVMDADYSHNPKLIPTMLKKINECDVVLGSRYAKNGGGENKQRFLLSKIYNIYLRNLLRVNISDFLFGYFCMRKEFLIKNHLLNKDVFKGFGDYFIRLSYFIDKVGGSFYEIPVYYKNRIYGESKSNLIKMLFTYTYTSLEIYYSK